MNKNVTDSINTAQSIMDVEREITAHQAAIADLRERGARLLAYQHASGQDVLRWLTTRGMSDRQARNLCVVIIHELRAVQAK